jgi:hypothetical protein
MRLLWRYFTPEGKEVSGNSARDEDSFGEDEVPVPKGEFRVKLVLKKSGDGTDVKAYVNGRRFAHKELKGLSARTAKIAVGCRNSRCEFDALKVTGMIRERPPRRAE